MRYLSVILGLLLITTGCGDLVDGINQDPNNPTSASYQNILTGSQVGAIIVNTGESARRAGIFSGYYTGIDRQHQGFSSYTLTTRDFNSLWYDIYVDTYRNALEAEQAALETGFAGVTQGITQVLQAYAIGMAASLYGDIPFADAGDITIENPRYESQTDVYQGVQDLLDEAITNLGSGSDRPAGGSDIYFDGNPVAWTQVAYSLKARFYLHTREYANAYDAAQQGISDPANSLRSPHGSGLQESNLTYLFFAVEVRGADVITSDFFTSIVQPDAASNPAPERYRGHAKTDETGRFNFYFTTNSLGVQPNTTDGFAAQTATGPMVTYEENLLTLAEAGFRSQGFATGLGHLNDFRAYMNTGGYLTNAMPGDYLYESFVEADFANGGLENPDGISADDALLREILEERYVTFFGQIEGFNDMRRTLNQTTVAVAVPPNVGSQLPARFLYPQTEIDRNDNAPSPIPGFFEPTPVNQ